jgi:hypothetical protein
LRATKLIEPPLFSAPVMMHHPLAIDSQPYVQFNAIHTGCRGGAKRLEGVLRCSLIPSETPTM